MNKLYDDKMTARTIKIIQNHGKIVLKHNRSIDCYLGQWTNIAAGWDAAHWSRKRDALEIFNLKFAFALAKLFDCKVVVLYPRKK